MLIFDQLTNTWSEENVNIAMSNFAFANFVQTGSVSFIIGNVRWNGNSKETIVRYQASKMFMWIFFIFHSLLFFRRVMDGLSTLAWPCLIMT